MLLLKLTRSRIDEFAEQPEAVMGLQFVRIRNRRRDDELGFILSGRVLMLPRTGEPEEQEKSDDLAKRLWRISRRNADPLPTRQDIRTEEELIDSLFDAPGTLDYADPFDPFVMGFILNPPGHLPPAPARPASIYGHLPFTGLTQAGDVFYRCEHWATSRRVQVGTTNNVLAGTYGFPASELSFVPTGFAAVGRYALPDLPPACRRYEITPPTTYTIECGASVPLYGQAGGGVEVKFPRTFTNAVTLPAPTILPPL